MELAKVPSGRAGSLPRDLPPGMAMAVGSQGPLTGRSLVTSSRWAGPRAARPAVRLPCWPLTLLDVAVMILGVGAASTRRLREGVPSELVEFEPAPSPSPAQDPAAGGLHIPGTSLPRHHLLLIQVAVEHPRAATASSYVPPRPGQQAEQQHTGTNGVTPVGI